MITRIVSQKLQNSLYKNKVVLLLGARQTGKSTLLKKIISQNTNGLWLNGDEYDIQELFKNATSVKLKTIIGNHKLVVIDEAQRIDNIGLCIKLIHDTYPDIQLIATGSSAFDLKNKTNEPLTGRKIEFQLFPFSFEELSNHESILTEKRNLTKRLVYGSYPDVINNSDEEIDVLKLLSDSYLFKDVLMLDAVKKPEKLVKLLQALAFQIGSEVSYNEIGNLIGLDSKTVENYINLLEKSFVIFKLNSFNKNLRNELKLSKKVYFYDNGIRNAIINNFQFAETRQDIGALFENYLISERMKYNAYHRNYVNTYFWRTKDQQEIDYIEEKDGILYAFEFKWSETKKVKFSKTFTNAYPDSSFAIISKDNYDNFLCSDAR
jgi:predicted AAA+ superfamily ATPase